MADGTATYDFFYMIGNSPSAKVKSTSVSAILPTPKADKCCSDSIDKVYADLDDSNEYKNDKRSVLFDLESSFYQDAELILQKWDGSEWQTADLLDNNDNGTFYDFGFNEVGGSKFIGYVINWRDVLDTHGVGAYRVKCLTENVLGDNEEFFSDEYCLNKFNPIKVNGTIRLECYISGEIGHNIDDKSIVNYGDILPSTGGWYYQTRYKGFFGYKTSEYKTEEIQYENGAREPVIFEQEPVYLMRLKQITSDQLDFFRTQFIQSNRKLVTDYNNNITSYVQKEVNFKGSFNPEITHLQSKKIDLECEFVQTYNNFKKRR